MTATLDRELVTVATFDVPMSAMVVKNALAADGIPAVVSDADVTSLLGEATGGAKVQVPAGYAAEAALRIAALDAAGGTETFDVEELNRMALSTPPEGV